MEEGLALAGAAGVVAGLAIFLDLSEVSTEGSPALDLALVVGAAAAKVVAAVPLEPAAGIFGINPAFALPFS